MIEQLGGKCRDAGELHAGDPIDRIGDGDDIVGRKAALVTAIERISWRDDTRHDGLRPTALQGRGARLRRLFQVEDGPVIGRHRRRRVGFMTRDLYEMADVADAETRSADGACAFHVDRDRLVDAALRDGAAKRPVAAHLFGHGVCLEAELDGVADDYPRVGLHCIEIDDIAVGGNRPGLVQRDRLFDQRGIAAANGIEKHGVLSLQRSGSRSVRATATRMMRPRAII